MSLNALMFDFGEYKNEWNVYEVSCNNPLIL